MCGKTRSSTVETEKRRVDAQKVGAWGRQRDREKRNSKSHCLRRQRRRPQRWPSQRLSTLLQIVCVRSLRAVVCARTALPSGSSTVVVVERVAARDARSVLRWRRRVPPILAAIVRLRAHVSIAAAAPLSLPSRPGLRGGRSDSRLSLLSILFFFSGCVVAQSSLSCFRSAWQLGSCV